MWMLRLKYDIALLATSEEGSQTAVIEMNNIFITFKLIINVKKQKYTYTADKITKHINPVKVTE